MMTNIFWGIAWLLGTYVGWHLHKAHLANVAKKMQQAEEDERENNRFKPSLAQDKINVFIKKDGDIFYVYARDDGMFLAQGRSAEEVSNHLLCRFPNKTFYGSDKNIEEVGYK